jgi:DNA polymerase-3 subunit beta
MKFIVTSTALLKHLQMLGGVLNSSNTIAILDNFLFEVRKKELVLSASDLETSMSCTIPVEAKEEGVIAIPAKMLMDVIKTLPDQPLTFTIDTKLLSVEISSDYGKYKLAGFNGGDFPEAPSLEGASSITMKGDVLSRAISKTLFAAGNDDMRPVMNGIFLEIHEDNIRFVATDAHKLVLYKRTDMSGAPASMILPRKPMGLLKGMVQSFAEEVKIEYNENSALFTFGNIVMLCRLIDGKYPNYEMVIPQVNPFKLTIDRLNFVSSLRRVSIFSNKTTHQVRMKLGGSEIHLSAEDLDFANEARERLTCAYAGDDMEIGFNSKFLAEMLSNLESENVQLDMSAPNRAGLLSQVENDREGESILMMVMPVMLNN